MNKYSCGYLFSKDKQYVLLVKKSYPEHVAGCLSGIGDMVTEEEGFHDGLKRAFFEATGLYQPVWDQCASATDGEDYQVQFFYAFADISQAVSATEDHIMRVAVSSLKSDDVRLTNVTYDVLTCLTKLW